MFILLYFKPDLRSNIYDLISNLWRIITPFSKEKPFVSPPFVKGGAGVDLN